MSATAFCPFISAHSSHSAVEEKEPEEESHVLRIAVERGVSYVLIHLITITRRSDEDDEDLVATIAHIPTKKEIFFFFFFRPLYISFVHFSCSSYIRGRYAAAAAVSFALLRQRRN